MLSYHDANLFVVCFSLLDANSLTSVTEKYIPEILSYRPDAPFILVGTKWDIREKVPLEFRAKFKEITSFEQGLEVANKLGAEKYVELTAIDSSHVRQLFLDMVQLSLYPLEQMKKQRSLKNKCTIL